VSFPTDLQAQLDRLAAAGWTRDQIAAPTGYTRQRLSAWARGPGEPPNALRVGLLSVLRRLKGKAPEFACPKCGSGHFGRDTEGEPGAVRTLRTVRCHGSGCDWRGVWPNNANNP
jgi:hypothetical protein